MNHPAWNLKQSLEWGGHGLLAWLDPQNNYLPVGGYEVAHDVGRWWDAILRLEAATGFEIPKPIEAAMLANFRRLTDNPDGLLITENHWKNKRQINPHNLRETMIAYHALARWRDDDWARAAGHRFLEILDRGFRDDGHFDATRLGVWGQMPLSDDSFIGEKEVVPGWFDATQSTGRCLEGVVWFHKATGDELALAVANRLARHHLRMMVDDNGEARLEFFREDNPGHNHSYLGTLRGLLLFGLLTGERNYVDAVTNVYRHSLWQRNIAADCWATHDIGMTRCANAQREKSYESASAGDVAQLALWLGLRDGQADLLDDVERILRAHLLPIQITAADLGIVRPDGRQIGEKWLGGWGCLPDRSWKDSTHDVLAAVVHSLADIHNHTVVRDALGLTLNWHFDYTDDQLRVTGRRTTRTRLRIERRSTTALRVRLPAGTAADSLRIRVGRRMVAPARHGAYLQLPDGSVVTVEYRLADRETGER